MRRSWIAASLAVGLAASPRGADAALFYVLSRAPGAWTVIDPAAAEVRPDGIRRVWTLRVQKSIVNGGPDQPGYVRSLAEYDCAQRRTRWLRFTLYSSSGAVVMNQKNPKDDWGPPLGGEGAAALALLCGDRGGKDLPVLSAPTAGDLIVGLFADWRPAAGQ